MLRGLGFLAILLLGPWLCLQLQTLIHELGHALAGWGAGLKVLSIRVGPIRIAPRRPFVSFAPEVRGRNLLGGATTFVPLHVAQVPKSVRIGILGGSIATGVLVLVLVASLIAWGSPGGSDFILAANATYAAMSLLGSLTVRRSSRNDGSLLKLIRDEDPRFLSSYRFATLTAATLTCRYKRDTGLPLQEALDRAVSDEPKVNPGAAVLAAIYALEEKKDDAAVSLLEAVLESDAGRHAHNWLVARWHLLAFVAVVRRDPEAFRVLRQRPAPKFSSPRVHPRSVALFGVAELVGVGRMEDARRAFESIRFIPPATGSELWLDDRIRDLFSMPLSSEPAKP